MNNTDLEYQRLLRLILEKGRVKKNRTGTDTIGVFGAQARFNLQEGFPLLTTKKMAVKAITHELLWFIKGDTNIKYLVDNNVHIWDGDCYRNYKTNYQKLIDKGEHNTYTQGYDAEQKKWILYSQDQFIDKIKTDNDFAQKWGDLGQGTYGQMWRAFPYFDEGFMTDESIPRQPHTKPYGGIRDTSKDSEGFLIGTVDQLQKVIDKLKTNPDDRRMIVSAWHPYWVDHCALPPCHCLFHFNTEELTIDERLEVCVKKLNSTKQDYEHAFTVENFKENNPKYVEVMDNLGIPKRRLNCLLYQRSCDTFLGVPFNIASYGLLTSMVAHSVGMVAGEFVHTYGDLHIYSNHVDQCKEQLTREPKKLPTLWLNPKKTDIFDFTIDDIRIENYESHPAIKGEVSTG